MSGVLNFLKLNTQRLKRYWMFGIFMLLLPLVILAAQGDPHVVFFVIAFSLYTGMIISIFPWTIESPDQIGFLKMLPHKDGDDVVANFIFTLIIMTMSYSIGIISLVFCHFINPIIPALNVGGTSIISVYTISYGLALLMAALQNSVHHLGNQFNGSNGISRSLPSYAFFFMLALSSHLEYQEILSALKIVSLGSGIPFVGLCIMVYFYIAKKISGMSF